MANGGGVLQVPWLELRQESQRSNRIGPLERQRDHGLTEPKLLTHGASGHEDPYREIVTRSDHDTSLLRHEQREV